MSTYELKITKRGADGWKDDIPETDGYEVFVPKLIKLLEKHDQDAYGSYRAILKSNGGYAKNHDTGLTMDVNWKGPLKQICSILDINIMSCE